uniref:Uncharacterized protein n=1 Tax=Candidatus Kentrum eta TaxID=2126337 RepID=A0A450VHN0_9GAMM|nr:MAG: hypothetical protein BECKH772A_GA0070896_100962 [Candidatus Kentron sp. H]VFK04342.1 MAG: hypothetical protein BECKH772B_GA0070898_104332 [Candidatus Kentron sp. H]VFK07575.1 MAG: hypothetical protein BECKH772C_GA0070978_104342 [Candidatus Kentron sp. H]
MISIVCRSIRVGISLHQLVVDLDWLSRDSLDYDIIFTSLERSLSSQTILSVQQSATDFHENHHHKEVVVGSIIRRAPV